LNAEPISERKEQYEAEGHDSEDPDETLMENRQSNMQMDDEDEDDDYDEEEANDQFDPRLDQKIQQIKNNYN
jgi:hypothetical protein